MEPSATNTASLGQLSVVEQAQTLINGGFPCYDYAPHSAIGDCSQRAGRNARGLLGKGFQACLPLKPVIEQGTRKIKEPL